MAMNNGSCRCESCGQRFRSLQAFEMHRAGAFGALWKADRRCLTEAEMLLRGMRENSHGAWVTGREFHVSATKGTMAA
jgi:hypothetical protein